MVKKIVQSSMTKTNKLVEELEIKSSGKKTDQFTKKFTTQFLALLQVADPDYYQQLIHNAARLFDFASSRQKNETKIRIYNASATPGGPLETIIEIVSDEIALLAEAIKEQLKASGIQILEFIYSNIKIRRNEQGEITDISDKIVEEKGEMLLYIRFPYVSDKKAISAIYDNLYQIVEYLKIAEKDSSSLLNTVNKAIAELPEFDTEEKEFLQWLLDDNFLFLGYLEPSITNSFIEKIKPTSLGIAKNSKISKSLTQEITRIGESINKKPTNNILVKKLSLTSPVRNQQLDAIIICKHDEHNNLTKFGCLIGSFANKINYHSLASIPLIRKKIDAALTEATLSLSHYNAQEVFGILESLRREIILQISHQELVELTKGIYVLLLSPKVKLYVYQNDYNNLISCILLFPTSRLSSELTKQAPAIVSAAFGNLSTFQPICIGYNTLSSFYVLIETRAKNINDELIKLCESQLEVLTNSWSEELHNTLIRKYGKSEGEEIFLRYKEAFPSSYCEHFTQQELIIQDIDNIERTLKDQLVIFDLYKPHVVYRNESALNLKIYSANHKISLSEVMPILDNMGFKVIEEDLFLIKLAEKSVWIHDFHLNISGYETQAISEVKEYEILENSSMREYVQDALVAIWNGKVQDNRLNKLIIRAGLYSRQIILLRSFVKYIRQTGFAYSLNYIEEVLTHYPLLVKLLIELFYNNFEPSKKTKAERIKQGQELVQKIEARLAKAVSSAEDRVLRMVFNMIRAISRTNYFQKEASGTPKYYISFKINSALIPDLPLPRPYAEIFIYSTRMEGIHLRGGKVARGGIRWSDRSEDYRTEVLGLMKAQMTKNSVIVPVGSKGGFIVKQPLTLLGREEYFKEGQECYRIFLRGLLDVTDNVIDGKVVTPKNVIRYDGDDPYLVVAADKGTATFSDIANQVAAEYNFWLGDAFASGGSAGYDHKKMGITARGAWISVQRHFREMGLNMEEEEFTVVGIGDMSGDVFGNGMLLSDNIRLVAAFNHLHIFIDPSPNSKISYAERQRLFNLPGSTWSDYNPALISKGGAIFERKSKTISLTREIKTLLSIQEDQVTPEFLISKILTASVDLLWNGGIGVYVKCSEESNDQVGDRTNDAVRVNGRDLRARVVAEGGNLGVTQRGRIEYALCGGRINTDAIDNSAGVDCSDHEVNIKIALRPAVEQGKLPESKRVKLLEQMTDEVASLVLRDNFLQTQAITIGQLQGHSALELYSRLMNKLEAMKILNRAIEFLPDKQEISRRNLMNIGLTRAEIAVLMAYSKITIYNELIKSDLPDDPYYAHDLRNYFPKIMREKYQAEIDNHILRREIIATGIANSIVNRMDLSFYFFAQDDSGARGSDIAKAYTVTRDSFELRGIWVELEQLDPKINVADKVVLFTEISKLVSRCVFWLLRNENDTISVELKVAEFRPVIKEVTANLDKMLNGKTKERYQDKLSKFLEMSIPKSLARKIASISVLSSAYDIVHIASKNNLPVQNIGKIYFELGTRLNFDWLRACIDKIKIDSYWQRLSLKTLKDDLYDLQREITSAVLEHNKDLSSDPITKWCKNNQQLIERYDHFITDLLAQEVIDFPMIVLGLKRAGLLLKAVN